MKTLTPFNRHIIVQPEADEPDEETAAILLPDEYRPRPAYVVAKVVSVAEDCKAARSLKPGDRILCNNSMVEEVKIDGEAYYLLLENYVLCLVS